MKIKEITEAQMAGQYKIVKTGPEGTTLQSPDMHTMLTLDPEAAKGIVQNPDNPNEFTLSQQVAQGMTNQQQPGQQGGIKQGATVEIPANEGHDEGNHEFELEIENPNWNPDDENSYDTLRVGVNYSIYGEERPATWGYHGGEPSEHPEIDELSVVDLDTGEDITDSIDTSEIEQAIWHHEKKKEHDLEEKVGGDDTDDFIRDVTDKEFEKVNRPGVGNRSPVAEQQLKTELDKMLTIAGLR